MKESKEKIQSNSIRLRANRALIGGAFNINLRKNQTIEVDLSKEDLALGINEVVKLSQSQDINEIKKAFILDSIITGVLSIVNI
jgi:hypothetical protein